AASPAVVQPVIRRSASPIFASAIHNKTPRSDNRRRCAFQLNEKIASGTRLHTDRVDRNGLHYFDPAWCGRSVGSELDPASKRSRATRGPAGAAHSDRQI